MVEIETEVEVECQCPKCGHKWVEKQTVHVEVDPSDFAEEWDEP